MLSVEIKHGTGKGKCPTFSDVKIYLNELLLAEGKLGGKYNDKQAITELKNNPKRFKINQENYTAAKGLNLL